MSKEKIIEEYKKIPLPIYFQAYNKEAQSELVKFSKEVIQPFLEQALISYTEKLKKKIKGMPSVCTVCGKEGVNIYGECKCSYEDSGLISRSKLLSELNHQ